MEKTSTSRKPPALLGALAVCLKARVPVYLESDPGCGKTSMVLELARAIRRQLIVVTIAGIEDLYVVSRVVKFVPGKGQVEVARHLWNEPIWEAVSFPERYLLFIDELNDPNVMLGFQKLLVPGTNSGIYIPEDIMIICAGNPSRSATTGYDLSPALANRLCILTIDKNPSDVWESSLGFFENKKWVMADYRFEVDPPVRYESIPSFLWDAFKEFVKPWAERLEAPPTFDPNSKVNTTKRSVHYAFKVAAAAYELGLSWYDPAFQMAVSGLLQTAHAAKLIGILTKRYLRFDDLISIVGTEEYSKIDAGRKVAALKSFRPEKYIKLDEEGGRIVTDVRLVKIAQDLKGITSEAFRSLASEAIRYVQSRISTEWKGVTVMDWDAREAFTEEV